MFLTNTRVFDKEEEPLSCNKALVQKLADGPATQAPKEPMLQEAHGNQTLQINRKSSFLTKGKAETKSRQTPEASYKNWSLCSIEETKTLLIPVSQPKTESPHTSRHNTRNCRTEEKTKPRCKEDEPTPMH